VVLWPGTHSGSFPPDKKRLGGIIGAVGWSEISEEDNIDNWRFKCKASMKNMRPQALWCQVPSRQITARCLMAFFILIKTHRDIAILPWKHQGGGSSSSIKVNSSLRLERKARTRRQP